MTLTLKTRWTVSRCPDPWNMASAPGDMSTERSRIPQGAYDQFLRPFMLLRVPGCIPAGSAEASANFCDRLVSLRTVFED